jgi:hypothetical protein
MCQWPFDHESFSQIDIRKNKDIVSKNDFSPMTNYWSVYPQMLNLYHTSKYLEFLEKYEIPYVVRYVFKPVEDRIVPLGTGFG